MVTPELSYHINSAILFVLLGILTSFERVAFRKQ